MQVVVPVVEVYVPKIYSNSQHFLVISVIIISKLNLHCGILHLQFNEHQPNFLPLSLTMKAKASINYYSVTPEYMYLSVRRGCKIGMMLVGWSDVCSCADCYPGCVLGLPGGSFEVRLGANTFPPEGYHLAFKGLPPSPSPPSRPPP